MFCLNIHGNIKMVKLCDSTGQQIVKTCCSQYLMSDCCWGSRVSRWAMRAMMHRRYEWHCTTVTAYQQQCTWLILILWCVCTCVRARGINWLITIGGQNRPRVLGIVIYEGDKLERNKKYWRDICPPCTSQVTPIGEMIWENKIGRQTRKWG